MDEPSSLPADFLSLLAQSMSPTEVKALGNCITGTSPSTSIRINPNKPTTINNGVPIPWCSTGFYLPERPSFTFDPGFHAGAYYVQEPSSMFIEQIIKKYIAPSAPIKALDLCAAPGGKSTHLLSLLNKDSLLVSNEVIRPRAYILTENIQKWGNPNVVITQNDPAAFKKLKGYFDLILVDAPCSGEGLFRKEPEAMQEWSIDNVQLCSHRQRRILSEVFPALAQDGLLIYCTCTFNSIENEENLLWLVNQHDVEFHNIPEASAWGIEEVNHHGFIGYRFLPHRLKGEGFFISILSKKNNEPSRLPKGKMEFPKQKLTDSIHKLIINADEYQLTDSHEGVTMFPKKWISDLIFLTKELNCLQAGTTVGTFKRDKFIPSHSLALSIALQKNEVARVELNKEEALKYLRKEPIYLSGIVNGYTLITYSGLGLGWINQLENRSNNLYPTNWRIRKQNH